MHAPHNKYNVEWTNSVRKPQSFVTIVHRCFVWFASRFIPGTCLVLIAFTIGGCIASLVSRMNIQHMRHTTTICHEKKPHTIEILIMQHLYFRFQGNWKCNDLNKHATVPMCNANQQAPHANNVISNGSQSNRPLWCGRCEFRNEGLKGFLWRCNSWTICVHGYWKTKQSYFDPEYIFMAMQMTKAEAISNCAL